MITVTLLKERGRTCGFTCSGHANHGEYGEDLVCAAVSALTQTCVLGVTEVLCISAGASVSEEDGIHLVLAFDTPKSQSEKAAILFDTMEKGLQAIETSYPGTLNIIDREV